MILTNLNLSKFSFMYLINNSLPAILLIKMIKLKIKQNQYNYITKGGITKTKTIMQISNKWNSRQQSNQTSLQKIKQRKKRQGETQRSFHSLHSYQQAQKQKIKFAQEYAKLTKQFRAILAKSGEKGKLLRDGTSSSLVKRFKMDSISKDKRAITQGPEEVRQNRQDESQDNKNDNFSVKNKIRIAKLQDLYNNRLHNEIIETASKLSKNKKQKLTILTPLSPQQKPPNQNYSPSKAKTQQKQNQPVSPHAPKQLFVHLQNEKKQKINSKFNKISETLAHFHNIYKIYELLENYKNGYSNLIKNIKKYVMNYNGADIPKLQGLLKIGRDRERLKVFLCLEKIAIIGILDAMLKENELGVKNEGKVILEAVFGVYFSIFEYILEENRQKSNISESEAESIQMCIQLIESHNIQCRKDLQSTSEYLYKKIQSLFRSNLVLFHKIKQLMITLMDVQLNNQMNLKISSNPKVVPTFSINVNRFFYYLLSEYSHWLNSADCIQILKIHKNMLDFFVTSPSPHLTFAPAGKMSIVVQLEGVLALVKSSNPSNQKISIRLRPHALQLLQQLHDKAQIIIMTTLLPQNLQMIGNNIKANKLGVRKKDPVQQLLSLSNCILYKYHYVRYHGLLVKDMNRIGRKPENLILVDGISYPSIPPIDLIRDEKANTQYLISQRNSSINEQNLIPISTWRGNPQDQQLLYLKQIILNIIAQQPEDVRQVIKKLKATDKNIPKPEVQQRVQVLLQENKNELDLLNGEDGGDRYRQYMEIQENEETINDIINKQGVNNNEVKDHNEGVR